MNKIEVFSKTGVKAKIGVSVPKSIAEKADKSTINQAIRVYTDRSHAGHSKVKTRAEINITKKKIYRQKGTGNARHGAASAHIFVGGGVAHGPKATKRVMTLPANMKKVALKGVMAQKIEAGKVVAVEDLGTLTKTKDANKILLSIKKETKAKGKTLFVLPAGSDAVKAIRNLPDCRVMAMSALNAYEVNLSSLIILDRSLL
jgi:large subunit ribosomal protein L4